MAIRLVDVGKVSYLRSQAIYHGIAAACDRESPNTIILASPIEPFICIGYHQAIEVELDLAFCKANNLPIVRRELGGGAVYLDSNQLFTQWVFQPSGLPLMVKERYAFFSTPLVETYKAFGIDAYFQPVNDIQVGGKKICGTGAAAVGGAEVMVGNLIFDFDFELMTKILKAPNQKFREVVYESLISYMTTMKKELSSVPDRQKIKEVYIQKCRETLAEEVVEGVMLEDELEAVQEYEEKFASSSWIMQDGGLRRRGVKIHSDVWIYESTYKARTGLIHVIVRVRNNRIDDIWLAEDVKFQPQPALTGLEKMLVGCEITFDQISEIINKYYESATGGFLPEVEPEDWVQAILLIKSTKQQN